MSVPFGSVQQTDKAYLSRRVQLEIIEIIGQVGNGVIQVVKSWGFLISVLITAYVSVKLANKSVVNTHAASPPARQRRASSWLMYKEAKAAGESPELVEYFRQSFERDVEAARWEDEVLQSTSYGSPEQAVLLKIPFRQLPTLRINQFPKFEKNNSWFLTVTLIIWGILGVMHLIILGAILIYMIGSWVYFVEGENFHGWMFLGQAFLLFLMQVLVGACIQLMGGAYAQESGLVRARIEFKSIIEGRFGRVVDIPLSTLEKLEALKASIVDPELRKIFAKNNCQMDVSKSKMWKQFNQFFFAIKIYRASVCWWVGYKKPLEKLFH